jgi:hypothetical protein
MTTIDRLIRAGGVVLAAGAAIGIGAEAAEGFVDRTVVSPALTVLTSCGLVGMLLLVLGLPAWYAVQAHRAGRLGAVSFVMMFVGLAGLEVGTGALYGYVAPALYARPGNADLAELGALDTISAGFAGYSLAVMLLETLGLLLFGVAMIRAKVFPRWIGWVVALSTVAIFVVPVEALSIGVLLVAIGLCGVLIARGSVRLDQPQAAPVALAG